jgi:alpha-L-fucosidase
MNWYARNMYLQGHPAYDYHVRTYGHPSKVGFKDVIARWKADKWDPDGLMDLYQAAGAKYFVALANHHENFDTYASKYHEWNSTRIGPMKDIVGTWERICKDRGLRFGVSNHSAHAWHFNQTAYGYDAEGPLAGVRYDGYREGAPLQSAPWSGLNPRKLYGKPSMVVPDGFTSAKEMLAWHERNDRIWDENPPCDDREFTDNWFFRCQDLVDRYKPDLLYFDDTELPLGQAGLDITAHFYNANTQWHRGRNEAVVFAKELTPQHQGAVVLDLERGLANRILDRPWQTDTCIGNWFYDQSVIKRHGYKTAKLVLQMLADIVSKNGNLLLSVPLMGDGSIDEDERRILKELAAWMKVNGEAIFETRPFRVYGEGPAKTADTGNFNEAKGTSFTGEDLRFTAKGEKIYIVALDWPAGGRLKCRSLARGSKTFHEEILRVELLGAEGPLRFDQNGDAMTVEIPMSHQTAMPVVLRVTMSRPI